MWWIPDDYRWQEFTFLSFGWYADSVANLTVGKLVLKRFFLLMPILLLIVARTGWSTMLSIYEDAPLPGEPSQRVFLTIIALGWWDTGRGTGLVLLDRRHAVRPRLLVGWVWNLIALTTPDGGRRKTEGLPRPRPSRHGSTTFQAGTSSRGCPGSRRDADTRLVRARGHDLQLHLVAYDHRGSGGHHRFCPEPIVRDAPPVVSSSSASLSPEVSRAST